MRSFGRVRLLSILVLGLMLISFSQTAFAAAYARFTANGSSAATVTALSSSVRFDASSSTPAGTTYYWDFGDGSTLTTTNAVTYHTFAQYQYVTEYYPVKLTVYDGGASSTRTVLIEMMCSAYRPGGPACRI
ncbi:MAG: PKD domain-containing protein [Chloroflexi bacterium]|nr:PKD domain-containing protein [Chloroflexota bacterium]